MLRATTILFLAHAQRTFFSRRALLCLGLVSIPVFVALFIANFAPPNPEIPAPAVGYLLVVQAIVPLVAVILGSAVVAEEVEDRTISYLLARPIPRPAILLGRWFASLILISVLLAASAWLVVAILEPLTADDPDNAVPPGFQRKLVLAVVVGGYAYSAIFAAVGAWLKRAVLIGLGYTFAIEGFLANLPGSNQALTIQYWIKSYLMGDYPELMERYSGWLVNTDLAVPGDALQRLVIIGIVFLAAGSWILARRQFLLAA